VSERFVAMYVPHKEGGPVTGFRDLGAGEFEIFGSGFRDVVSVKGGGFRIGH
jgi:hypothetical protein